MSGIDADALDDLRNQYETMAKGDPCQAAREHNWYVGAKILSGLKAMGLDLTDDATYELLAEKLTKREFDQRNALLLSRYLMDFFYES